MSSLEKMPQPSHNNSEKTRGDGGMLRSLLNNSEENKNRGPKYWKSLGELADSSEYKKFVEREFPENASEFLDPVSRRGFLGIMASSMALAGVTGCGVIRRPEEKILPYNDQPESVIPGKPTYYATSMSRGEEVIGLVVETHEGRPTKVEGNKLHSASLGATNAYHQAEVLSLYDPARNQYPTLKGEKKSWGDFWSVFEKTLEQYKATQGEGLRFVSGTITSPTTASAKAAVLAKYPKAKWHTYESVNQDNVQQGLFAATGQKLSVHYQLEKASRILSLDCDFLATEQNNIANTKGFVKTRDPKDKKKMGRLYALESNFSVTGGRADHRFKLKPSELRKALWVVADQLFNRMGLPLPGGVGADFKTIIQKSAKTSEELQSADWLKPLCEDLLQHGSNSLVCVGKYQEPALHALAHVMNLALGGVGRTVHYKENATAQFNDDNSGAPDKVSSLRELSFAMEQGNVETLVILGENPAYSAPSDIAFGKSLEKVANTLYLGTENNETAALCNWVLPRSHFMEEWSDGIATDGTVSIAQPMIAPLYETTGEAEFLAQVAGNENAKSRQLVEGYWRKKYTGASFENSWRRWLHDGIQKGTNNPNVAAGIRYSSLKEMAQGHLKSIHQTKVGKLEVLFREHNTMYDGRYANNGWLQELPDPMTRLTWDNAAIFSITTAEKYGLKDKVLLKNGHGVPLGDNDMPVITVSVAGQKLDLPVYILPGLSDDTILLNMGYGREHSGPVGQGTGFNVAALQTSHEYSANFDISFAETSKTYPLATTQEHWSMEGRDLARVESTQDHGHHHHGHGAYPSLFKEQDYSQGQQWGMAIDLNKCSGCGGCVTACQAENNIPVVGKEQVILNREMHWIRMDRYFTGDNVDEPQVVHQAVACQHCEMAPCETVCPVAATVHSSEGLNDMAYNRCIGTRYCSNNCPYKVRRFNFFNYTNEFEETEKMAHNPDVTLRFRGVMEKCTYCVQRINEARIEYKNKGVEWIPDGAISVACEQACAADAIVFGNINDPKSQVAKWKEDERNYDLLAEFNTRPRTSYLARVTNPNPKIVTSHSNHSKH